MNRYCLVCTPRSGSFYVLNYLAKERNLECGKEWFGRAKEVLYDDLKTRKVDTDYTLNEDLLTNSEIARRRMWLTNRDNFIIKCMPLQLSNTTDAGNLSYNDRLKIAAEILLDYDIIWLTVRDKISQFCFRYIAFQTSKKNYAGKNREYSDYDIDNRKTPPPKSFTATKHEFDRFMKVEAFTNDLKSYFPDCEEIVYEEFMQGREHIENPDYSQIMTNYDEVCKWFTT